ncbi:MAG: carbohydrate-binding domain-containing protein [Acholeplasma sp.]|nr:carbohydrate-binding domain-containing protein [Acholeplasma sp.]
MKKILLVILMIVLTLGFASCNNEKFTNPGDSLGGGEEVTDVPSVPDTSSVDEFEYVEKDIDTNISYSETDVFINLSDNNTVIENNNSVTVSNNIITISKIGTYVFSGKLSNGRIYVNLDGNVHLVFNNVDIKSNDGSPLVIMGKKAKSLTLVKDSNNRLEDSSSYEVFYNTDNDEPNGALFSKKALTINGSGNLSVIGNYNNGISVKDTLKIIDASVTVVASNNGIKGNDQVIIKDATVNISSNGDGIKSDNEDSAETGIVYIENSKLTIDSDEDGIQAFNLLEIKGGKADITTFGGVDEKKTTEDSAKGLKSDGNIVLHSGTFTLNNYDDAVHSAKTLKILDGTYDIKTKDDGIHSDDILEISGGTITISKSYEGLEAAKVIINGGTISIVASDDGINASDGTETKMGKSNPNCQITINGGNVTVNASGDGIDSNGTIVISGGVVVVYGPTTNNDGSLDADGGILVNGGTVIALGTLGMVETPGSNSLQNVVSIAFSKQQSANRNVVIKDKDGKEIMNIDSLKNFQSLIFSSVNLINGDKYKIYVDGTLAEEFSQTSVITYVGSTGRPGGNRPR